MDVTKGLRSYPFSVTYFSNVTRSSLLSITICVQPTPRQANRTPASLLEVGKDAGLLQKRSEGEDVVDRKLGGLRIRVLHKYLGGSTGQIDLPVTRGSVG